MSGPLRLILFDVDGTLVDSQDDIVRAMELSFEALGLTPPKRLDITGIIGLSLEIAVVRLMPGLAEPLYEDLVAEYKTAYKGLRAFNVTPQSSLLYPKTRDLLQSLWARPEYLLGCLLYTSPSPRDGLLSRMPSSA